MQTTTSQNLEMTTFSNPDEETLVIDERGQVPPSEHVERKLMALLNSATLPVSQLHQVSQLRRKHSGTS